jgi:hypothetical protein
VNCNYSARHLKREQHCETNDQILRKGLQWQILIDLSRT